MQEVHSFSWRAALAVTMLMQIALSFLAQVMAVLGPKLTIGNGVRSEAVGTLGAVVAFGTVWFLMSGGKLLANIGPVRLLQTGVLVACAGLVSALIGYWPMTILAALLVGFGYGPAPPAGNQILMNAVPAKSRALIFSIKQSGAPIGSALAGLLLPVLSEFVGWRGALATAAVFAAGCTLIVEPFRRPIDQKPSRVDLNSFLALLSPVTVFAPFEALGLTPALKYLAYAGFAFAVVQGSMFALYVTYLSSNLGFDLAFAGSCFAAMQLAGAVSRILNGWIADVVSRPALLLSGFGIASSVILIVISAIGHDWSPAALLTVSALTGWLVASWNGILMSEIAVAAPHGQVGATTSAATFFIFIGYTLGPGLFAAIIQMTQSYQLGWLALGAIPVTGSLALFMLTGQSSREDRSISDG